MRAFIALPLPQAALEALRPVALRLEALWPGLAWTAESNWHLTLAFLGEQGEEGLLAARAALASLAAPAAGDGSKAPVPAPYVSFSGLATFPDRGPWRVLVAGLGPPKALDLVYTRLNRILALESAGRGLPPLNADWPDAGRPGSRPRRPFRAHVTLARRSEDRPGKSRPCPAALDPGLLSEAGRGLRGQGGWPLEACVLYKSELRPGGAIYTELDRAFLARLPG